METFSKQLVSRTMKDELVCWTIRSCELELNYAKAYDAGNFTSHVNERLQEIV